MDAPDRRRTASAPDQGRWIAPIALKMEMQDEVWRKMARRLDGDTS